MLYADVRLAWKTQAGYRHQREGLENEDAVFVTHEHPLFDAVMMVADGMGGHPRPREASEIAVRAAREIVFQRQAPQKAGGAAPLLRSALEAAHAAVGKLWSGSGRRPATTLSVAVVADGVLYVAHVGDGSVYLMREGQVHTVAGGEDRRAGNRPAQYLGQELPLELEERQVPVAAGDRLLLCTDGLTRYFNEAGPEALERVLGREGVEVQAIASQLTAHSRPADYDDDTTVAVAEVAALSALPRRPAAGARESGAEMEPKGSPAGNATEQDVAGTRGIGAALAPVLTGLVVGTGVLAGFYVGRVTAPAAPEGAATAEVAVRPPADPTLLRQLPPGNLVLLDELGKRVYALPTPGGAPGTEPVDLQAFRVLPTGRLDSAGRYRLDPARGTLSGAGGRTYAVEVGPTGTIRLLQGGTLAVSSRLPGARVFIDGRSEGRAPVRLTLPAGTHRVRVEGEGWSTNSEVDVPAGRSIGITLGPQ